MSTTFEPQEFAVRGADPIHFAFDGRFCNMAVRSPEDGQVLFGSAQQFPDDAGCFSDIPELHGTVWGVVDLSHEKRDELLLTLWMPHFQPPLFTRKLCCIRVTSDLQGYNLDFEELPDNAPVTGVIGGDLLQVLVEQMARIDTQIPMLLSKVGLNARPPFNSREIEELSRLSVGPSSFGAKLADGEALYDELTG